MNMKHASYTLTVCALVSLSIYKTGNAIKKIENTKETQITSEQFTIKIEPRWEDLDKDKKQKAFEEKWIWAGNIVIKKTAPQYVSLHEIHLIWNGENGEKIESIIASLYEKENKKTFMPIEKYLICDSIWKKSEQRLILKFEHPKTLHSVNNLALVLTIPKNTEKILQQGHFTIDAEYLPRPYQEYAAENNLCLCFNTPEMAVKP